MISLEKLSKLTVINAEAHHNLVCQVAGVINQSIDMGVPIDRQILLKILEDSTLNLLRNVELLNDNH